VRAVAMSLNVLLVVVDEIVVPVTTGLPATSENVPLPLRGIYCSP
jgi:hypothetical protein